LSKWRVGCYAPGFLDDTCISTISAAVLHDPNEISVIISSIVFLTMLQNESFTLADAHY